MNRIYQDAIDEYQIPSLQFSVSFLKSDVWPREAFHSNENGTRLLRKLAPIQPTVCHRNGKALGITCALAEYMYYIICVQSGLSCS